MPYKQSERSRRHNESVRRRIVAAAGRLFADAGYEATTVRAVAAAAGTSTGNVYFHVGGKEALLQAVVEDYLSSLASAIDAVAQGAAGDVELLASLVYTGSREVQHRAAQTRVVMSTLHHQRVSTAVRRTFVDRTEDVLAAFPSREHDHSDTAHASARRRALAWQGSLFWVLEDALREHTAPGAGAEDEVAAFLVHWNLRALGVDEGDVDDALRAARRLYAAKRR
jgi:AcrR family transcriptional regulator